MIDSLNSKEITVDQVGRKSGKFVLFIRSGANCPLCLKDYQKNENVIVVLSRYQKNNFQIEKEFWTLSGGLSKFDSARLFFSEFPDFMNYEAYAFFDPDVEISFNEIHSLFEKGIEDRKAIFQPAVALGSHTFWKFLYNQNSIDWREVSFVEVMAPFFSKDALTSVIDGFSDSISTWGLEYYWYSKCKEMSMAVYDPIVMRHDTKVDTVGGPFYRYLAQLNINPSIELEKLRGASVSKFYIECAIPSWVPLWTKKYYIKIVAMAVLLRNRLSSTLLWRMLQRLRAMVIGNKLSKDS